jgi:tetratricopeptide (TPR) repeat protein
MRTVAACFAVGLAFSSARAEQPVAPGDADLVAREKASSAKLHFDRGELDQAIADYREAFRILPTPGLLYNLGQAYRLAGRCAAAADAYRRYLEYAPDSPYRAVAEQNLTAADVCARDSGEVASVDQPVGAPASTPATRSDRHDSRRRIGAVVAAGGAVLFVTGAYFALDAEHAEDHYAALYEHGGTMDELAAADARGRRSQAIARLTIAGGIGAVATGATLYWLGRRADRQPQVRIAPHARGGDVAVSWRF